jgi:Mrp family chromosome partitioning ATPase
VADPRTTNAPVPPHRLGAYDLATPPSGVSPTTAAPVPTGRSAEDQAQAAPPPFGGRQHEPPRRPASLPPRNAGRDTGHWTDPTAVAAQEAQQARQPELSSARLLRPAKRPPQSGWRRMIYVLSGRMFNPGESPTDVRRRELTMRVNQPLLGCYKIAMLSLKGGVGKTTMTATLGATFASLRGDRVVAVDANPDRGTLSQKIPLETSATVRNLLRDAQRVRRYTDVRAYTSQGPSRLEVLASEQDPAVSEAFSERDYRRTVDLLEHFYNIVLTD